MGTYLSTPVLDKSEESGEALDCPVIPVAWGVVDMQGWRKSMEDAHVARTDVSPPPSFVRKKRMAESEPSPPPPPPEAPPEAAPEAAPEAGAFSTDSHPSNDDSNPNKTNNNVEGGGEKGDDKEEIEEKSVDDKDNSPSGAPAEAEAEAETSTKREEETKGDYLDTVGKAKVFAVFDGHGGPEVARFCQLYLVDVLTTRDQWLVSSSAPQGDIRDNTTREGEEEEKDGTKGDVGAGEGALEEVEGGCDLGAALIETFHEIDRMIDDPVRREEIANLKTEKPTPGEQRVLQRPKKNEKAVETETDKAESKSKDDKEREEAKEEGETENDGEKTITQEDGICDNNNTKEQDDEPKENGQSNKHEGDTAVAEKEDVDKSKNKQVGETSGSQTENQDDEGEVEEGSETKDDDSDVAVGQEEAASDLDDPSNDADRENEIEESGDGMITTADAMMLFQKLLSIGGAKGKVTVQLNSSDSEEATTNTKESKENDTPPNNHSTGYGQHGTNANSAPLPIIPTRIQNGRPVCNLPDHPVHAGCTSVVAVLVGRTLTVANAGDSRAVLCRAGGITEALSFDHKPMQEREMSRITSAGGFVNQFGRVNGNLNLSRSIGDLKYKQVPGIPPSGQMITAEPDIVQVTLRPGDEFIILGCDGIWDCLSNEEAVKYVRDRIDMKTPTEIGREMLDDIVSEDPRVSQGIGGDNMTIMIVDLLPHTRPYRKTSA